MSPVLAIKIPLKSKDMEAIALRPIRSCNAIRHKQAGRMAVALKLNITKGEMPKPCTLRETAS